MSIFRPCNKENMIQRIMKFPIRLILLSVFVLFTQPAHANAMELCNQAVNSLNSSTPMQIDRMTVLKNAFCAPTNGKPILIYHYTLAVKTGAVNQAEINSLKPNQINSWCTIDETRFLFEIVDVRYVYMDRTGREIGSINMSISECSS
jgi:hypothetical protein